MCVNDLICSGAKPLFFLDYYACCKLNKMQLNALMDGMISACQDTGLSLVGGEIAEMGDCYRNNEFDLAGFCVGVVEKSAMITGQSIASGQYVYGLKSNGLHANGFSLVRRVLTESVCQERGIDPADLLAPTALYVQPIQALMAAQTVTGIAHITGGGLAENIARILPKHVSAILKKSAWTVPSIFEHIQLAGQVSDSDMLRTFNMGIGMVVITPTPISDPNYSELGYIVDGNGTVEWAP
jgi:phosphoribosylformylglycinamidine cyclo-ligase